MGRLVRCLNTEKVTHPLYAPIAGIHLYSLEELSYFLQHFLYLIDDSFFDTELMRFLREELKRRDLAELVLSGVSRISPVALAGELASAIGDMDESEEKQLKKRIMDFQRLPDSGKRKLQADMLLKQKEYDRASDIYLQLLQDGEQRRDKPGDEETGMIYYSLGKIYMAGFQWKKAGDALVNAYEFLHQESVLQELYELSCISPVNVCDKSIFSGIHAITIRHWQENFNRKKERIEREIAEKDYESMNRTSDGGSELPAEKVFREWKQDFRKISKSCCQGGIF